MWVSHSSGQMSQEFAHETIARRLGRFQRGGVNILKVEQNRTKSVISQMVLIAKIFAEFCGFAQSGRLSITCDMVTGS
jgi:hypothetical protein